MAETPQTPERPQAPQTPLYEAPISSNVYVMVDGHRTQVTVRGYTWREVRAKLAEVRRLGAQHGVMARGRGSLADTTGVAAAARGEKRGFGIPIRFAIMASSSLLCLSRIPYGAST